MVFRQIVQVGLILAVFQLTAFSAHAGDVRRTLISDSPAAQAGETLVVHVLWLNDGIESTRIAVPESIPCSLSTATMHGQRVLVRVDPEKGGLREIGPGSFFQASYRLNIPAELGGEVILRIDGADPVVVTFRRAAAGAPAGEAQPVQAAEEGERLPTAYFADNFSGYEPMYFLYGIDPQNAKFQFSLKYRILNTAGPLATRWSALRGFFVGYTQTSFWDLDAPSKPFEDTSYKPEIFYLRQDLPIAAGEGVRRVDVQVGLQHESNGRDGPESRSLDIAYIRPALVFGDPGGYHLSVSPKIWYYVGDLGDNPDIYRYRGYFDLHIDYGSYDGWKLASIWRKGTEGSNGSIQLDLTYPLNRIGFGNLDFFLQAQLFTGYGESLLYYDRSETRFRIGLGVYR